MKEEPPGFNPREQLAQWTPMLKPVFGFAWRFILIVALFTIPYPGWKQTYAEWFRSTATKVFASPGKTGVTLFNRVEGQGIIDTVMNVGDKQQLRPDGSLPTVDQTFSTRYIGYKPTVLVIALILATPIPMRRRLLALLWGLILVHLFIGFMVHLMILNLVNHTEWLTLYNLGPASVKVVDGMWNVFVYQVVAKNVVPVLIWIVVCFRKGDYEQIMALASTASVKKGKKKKRK